MAARLEMDSEKIYQVLAENSNILNEYIVPGYGVLHTQDKEYIVDDILSVMREEGIGV